MTDKFAFGDEVKEIITGFTGVISARFSYMNGCVRYQVSPRALKDGLPMDEKVFDQEQLELVKAGAVVVAPKPTGGPYRRRSAADPATLPEGDR